MIFFNYIFDAKILTYYHRNPYELMPGFFYNDEWIRFMHWTDRTYPYGPVFLPLTLIPSFLGFGKFILNYFFFKALSIFFYVIAVYYLSKIEKKLAIIFATHPLVIIEGLVNAHNDLIGVSLAIVGFYYLTKSKNTPGRILILLSAGIKYLTFPALFLSKNSKYQNTVVLALQIFLIAYLCYFHNIQSWYFLTFFVYLPIFPSIITKFYFFALVLLLSYYPYINFGNWEYLREKNLIVFFALIINIGFIQIHSFLNKRNLKKDEVLS